MLKFNNNYNYNHSNKVTVILKHNNKILLHIKTIFYIKLRFLVNIKIHFQRKILVHLAFQKLKIFSVLLIKDQAALRMLLQFRKKKLENLNLL